jgi:hypothetical protein
VKTKINVSSILLVSTLTFFTACSSPVLEKTFIERSPADKSSIYDELFSFDSKTSTPGKENFKSMAENSLTNSSVKVEYVQKKLAANRAFQIELDVLEGEYIYRIYHSPTAFKDPEATKAMTTYVQQLLYQSNQGALFEIYFNAKAEDPIALKYFYGLKKDYGLETSPDLEKNIQDEIKDLKAWQKVESAKRKAAIGTLDKAPEEKQFRTLIAKGDRKGAAKLLKTYLPWEMMAPFEKKYWETYLEVMVNPVPLEERVMIYRGLQDDFIHSGFSKGVALSQKEAIKQDNAFVMSTVMVKNQGSWNRRLRSLEAMYGKSIATASYTTDDLASAARIATMFSNHSGDPMGSPFLSFTPSLQVANSFGQNRVSAYLIDPRLLNFNYSSGFTHEFEYLVNLTTFPEDLIAILDKDIHNLDAYNADQRGILFEEKLIAKIEKEYGKDKAKSIITKIKKNSYTFFKNKMTTMPDVAGANPGPSNQKFYKALGKDTFKPDLGPKGELQCKDVVKLFW